MFNFEGEFYFKATCLTDSSQTMKGRIKVHEFNQEDNEVEIEPFSEMPGNWANKVRKVIKLDVPRLIFQEVKGLVPEMKKKDMDDSKVEAGLEKMKQADKEYKKVSKESKDKKDAIAE